MRDLTPRCIAQSHANAGRSLEQTQWRYRMSAAIANSMMGASRVRVQHTVIELSERVSQQIIKRYNGRLDDDRH